MRQIYLLVFCSLFGACALDIDYNMPANRFDTPEVSGRFLGGDVSLNYASVHKVTLGEVYEDVVFHTGTYSSDEEYIRESKSVNLAGDLGLTKWLDLFYRAQYDATDIAGLKIQFIGSGRSAKQNGLKAALTLGIGSENLDDDDLTLKNSQDGTTKEINSDLRTKAYDTSLIVGYRVSPILLVYLNNYYTHYKIDGHITANDGTDIHSKGISHNYGSLIGARLGETWYLTAEGGYSKGTFESLSDGRAVFGLATGYAW